MKIHRNQFIISRLNCAPDEGFRNLVLDNGYVLSYQEELSVADITNRSGQRFVLIGEAVDIASAGSTVEGRLAESSSLSEQSVFNQMEAVSGRWALIFGNIVISDPCALMALFYAQEGVISSSLALIGQMTGINTIEEGARELVFESFPDWYPVPLTRLKGVRRKLPGQYLQLSDTGCTVHFRRAFEPDRFKDLDKGEIMERMIDHFDVFFKNAKAKYGKLVLPLTSGVDSRTVFALAKHSGVEFTTMTMDIGGPNDETAIPSLISSQYHIPHTISSQLHAPDASLMDLWDRHTFKSSVSIDRTFLANGQYDCVPDGALMLRGNIWEIYAHYWHFKLDDAHTRQEVRQSILNCLPGLMADGFNARSTTIWLDDIFENDRGIEWRDLVMFEQRQSGWLGYIEQGLDLLGFYHIVPVDSALLLSMLFSLDEESKRDRNFQTEMIAALLPEIAEVPYNALTLREKIVRDIAKIRKFKSFSEFKAALLTRLGR